MMMMMNDDGLMVINIVNSWAWSKGWQPSRELGVWHHGHVMVPYFYYYYYY